MKKTLLTKLCFVALAVLALTAVVTAAGFEKTNTYADGKFTDVPSNQWYASEVKSAYELGFMNGQSDTLFAPDGNVTVAEGITMASRVHSIYNGKTIASVSGGKWYDMYIAYAKENGLIADGQFTNFDRNIMRYEMAVMFANAMPKEYFAKKNDVKDIPDVAETEEYYDDLMMLYNAGVVMGSDEYGNFYATNPIKRSETAAIINRVALPENRKSGTLEVYGDRDQAVFLIEDMTMTRTVRQIKMLASGWNYEDTSSLMVNSDNTTSNSLSDNSKEGRVAIHRDVTVQEKGVVKVDSVFTVSQNNGASIIFSDLDGNTLFKLAIVDNKYVATGDKEYVLDAAVSGIGNSKIIYFELDLDNNKAKVVIDAKDAGTFNMNSSAKNLARMSYATTDKDTLLFSIQQTHMYVNYDVNNNFLIDTVGEKPYGWDVTGDVKIETLFSDWDRNSVKMTGKATASKSFDAVTDKFVYETFLLPSKTADGYVLLKNGDKTALKIDIKAGQFMYEGKTLRKYDSRVWHLIRVEADTQNNKAVIKVNNKKMLDVAFNEDAIDGIEIVNNNADELWFDDVEVYNVFDYPDYCPVPVAVNDDEWLVGMSVCSLWREGTHYGWDCISPYEEITPVLGYYDEGLPEVADWEIKMLVEHGFDFQHYCWYQNTTTAPCKETKLSDAIIDGYMNAKYSDMMDMMIMWENNGLKSKNDAAFYESIWPYWCEWFFSDDRYFTIDNKPVITIYKYEQFVTTFGGAKEAKAAVDFMNEDIKRYGYDGIILLACGQFESSSAADFKQMRDIGFDASVNYSFGETAYDGQVQKDKMMACYNRNGLSLFPCIGVGFNDIGWTETRTPLITPEGMLELAQWARDEYMPLIAKRENDDWMSKFVFYTTWNEYGEGHYIFPSNTHGFGYIDANRKVFSSVAGKDDSKHFDVEPTLNQKARLGYLYPARHTPMRKTQYINTSSAVENNIPVLTWDFEKEEDVKKWVSLMNCPSIQYDATEKALVGTTTTNDGAITTINDEINAVDADKAKYLHVQIKYEKGITTKFDIFFVHAFDEQWTGEKGVSSGQAVYNDGEYHDYYVDLTKNAKWNGTVKDLRFDPMNYIGKFWIKKIEFLSDKAVGSFIMDVDGTEKAFAAEFTKKVGDEIFVAGNPSEGFYSLLNLYTEYNLVNGTLDLYGANGSKMSFVVGSDVVKVNGKDVKLGMAIERIDGLVTVPVKLICDTFGYEYTIDGDVMKVSVRNINYDETLESRVPFSYEFDIPGDTEGWTTSASKGNVVNGVFTLTADPVSYGVTGYDSNISNKSVNITAKHYNEIHLRIRPTFIDESQMHTAQGNISLYFTTDKDSTADEKKTFKIKWADMTKDDEGFYSYVIDTATNTLWESVISSIRLDPSNLGGMFEIDYIRIVADKEVAAMIEEENRKNAEIQEKIKAVDNGEPFYITNADAEDSFLTANLVKNPNYKSGGSSVTIVEDDLREGNHAYLVAPGDQKKTWTYFRAKTRFLPGKTYKVEFELRLVSDHKGNEASNVSIQLNPRYADTVDGVFKHMADHPVKLTPATFSTSDGWVKVTSTFTVNSTSEIRETDELSIFANPTGGTEDFVNYSYMVDNFVITVVE